MGGVAGHQKTFGGVHVWRWAVVRPIFETKSSWKGDKKKIEKEHNKAGKPTGGLLEASDDKK